MLGRGVALQRRNVLQHGFLIATTTARLVVGLAAGWGSRILRQQVWGSGYKLTPGASGGLSAGGRPKLSLRCPSLNELVKKNQYR